MRKGQMMEFIQRLIHDAAIEQLRKKKTVSPHEAPDMSDEELDKILFHGGMDKISESFDNTPKIKSSDITTFEQEMNNMLVNIPNAVLAFDQQKNGYSIMLKNEGQTIGAVASGKITFGNEGSMTWMFSIPNGFRMETDGLQITQANRDLFSDMANYYDSWQKSWRQKLNAPDGGQGMEAQKTENDPSFRSPAGAPAQSMGPAQPDAGAPPAMNV